MKASNNSQKLSVKKSIVSNFDKMVIKYDTIIVHTSR
jgi:hypothetical protein